MRKQSLIVICKSCHYVDTHEVMAGQKVSSKWCRQCRAPVAPLGDIITEIYKNLHSRYEEETPS
jgi:hypothetical protein